MLPELPPSPETSHTVKMLAIIEEWEVESDCHTDNTERFLSLMLFKLALDVVVCYLCCRRLYTSLISMCSLSIVLADLVMVFFLMTVWLLGPEKRPVSACFILAHASAIYGALPLPMMFLGLLDYCLDTNYLCKQSSFCKFLRNALLISLVWMLAAIYSFASVKAELMELDYMTQIKTLVCEVQECTLINYFTLVIFTAVIFSMLPFCSKIPRWVKEADRLSEAREEQENLKSDLFISTNGMKTKSSKEENYLEESTWLRPPLWLSLTLGFGMFWMPYLTISMVCLLFNLGTPAYITVNLLWLECVNSLLIGVVFWAKSNTLGPYSHLPESVCLWHVYWNLSKGTRRQQLPVAVFNPSKGKRSTLFYV